MNVDAHVTTIDIVRVQVICMLQRNEAGIGENADHDWDTSGQL